MEGVDLDQDVEELIDKNAIELNEDDENYAYKKYLKGTFSFFYNLLTFIIILFIFYNYYYYFFK